MQQSTEEWITNAFGKQQKNEVSHDSNNKIVEITEDIEITGTPSKQLEVEHYNIDQGVIPPQPVTVETNTEGAIYNGLQSKRSDSGVRSSSIKETYDKEKELPMVIYDDMKDRQEELSSMERLAKAMEPHPLQIISETEGRFPPGGQKSPPMEALHAIVSHQRQDINAL